MNQLTRSRTDAGKKKVDIYLFARLFSTFLIYVDVSFDVEMKKEKKKRKIEKEKKGQRKQFETHPFGIEFSPFDISKSDATIMCY